MLLMWAARLQTPVKIDKKNERSVGFVYMIRIWSVSLVFFICLEYISPLLVHLVKTAFVSLFEVIILG